MDHNAMSSKVNNALGVPKQCLFLDNQEVRFSKNICFDKWRRQLGITHPLLTFFTIPKMKNI